jgi:hypothetical protein
MISLFKVLLAALLGALTLCVAITLVPLAAGAFALFVAAALVAGIATGLGFIAVIVWED